MLQPFVKPFLHQKRHSGKEAAAAARLIGVMAAVLLLSACNSASDPNHPLRGPASVAGWATTATEPKDFVIARRGTAELAYVPIGRGGVERPVVQRDIGSVKALESQLDQTRDRSETFARRQLPTGAYGQPLPSVAPPPRAVRAPSGGSTASGAESYPVNPNRLRQIRENSRQATE